MSFSLETQSLLLVATSNSVCQHIIPWPLFLLTKQLEKGITRISVYYYWFIRYSCTFEVFMHENSLTMCTYIMYLRFLFHCVYALLHQLIQRITKSAHKSTCRFFFKVSLHNFSFPLQYMNPSISYNFVALFITFSSGIHNNSVQLIFHLAFGFSEGKTTYNI